MTGYDAIVLGAVIQPFPTFSEAFLHALRDLDGRLTRQLTTAAATGS